MAPVLLDTHALLWFIEDHEQLSIQARKTIEDPATTVLLSHATAWELAIKSSQGKLELAGGVQQFVEQRLLAERFEWLQPQMNHYIRVSMLPFVHRDPFDRMLVAQALEEDLPIITSDPHIPQYPGIRVLW
jgi:PIN domain nuclease of toxin-antitoxin system